MSPESQEPKGLPDPSAQERAPWKSRLGGQEYVTALSHFYRGEMSRTLTWRIRLDTTTNWAIVSTLGIFTFALNNPSYSQETLIAGMYANLVFLLFEARRFRFFDVWRARLRMVEQCFYGSILRGDGRCAMEGWGEKLADDLLRPKFKISLIQAVRARLLRNYLFVFAFLLLAWTARLIVLRPGESGDLRQLLAMGGFPWWVGVALVSAVYLGLTAIALFTPRAELSEVAYWSDPSHRGQDVPNLDV